MYPNGMGNVKLFPKKKKKIFVINKNANIEKWKNEFCMSMNFHQDRTITFWDIWYTKFYYFTKSFSLSYDK